MFKRKRSYARKTTRKRFYKKKRTTPIKRVYRRINAVSRKLAAEVFKFESTPDMYSNVLINYTDVDPITNSYKATKQQPLTSITSGQPWIMPLNWIYQGSSAESYDGNFYINGQMFNGSGPSIASVKNPIYRNTESGIEDFQDSGAQLQYRMKYIYINALFNASINASENNTDGAMRIVIICDKQPTGGTATWSDANFVTNSRGVFNADRINAQLNPNSLGRFTIMYDKTLRFNTINGYKPFKYFKRLSTIVRNNRGLANSGGNDLKSENSRYQTTEESAPVQKNAYYMMIFSDGLNFEYSTESSTPAASFNLFNRIAYYNN